MRGENPGTPRVTWLLPVKNGMPYIGEALASIAAQTYPNQEIIVWDNGSTDGTVEELARWIPDRIPGRIVSDRPLELRACRAALIEEAPTELCALMDADDVCLPQRIEKQVAFLSAHPHIPLVGTGMQTIRADGTPQELDWHPPSRHDDILHFLLHGNPFGQYTILCRRSAILAIGSYQAERPVEDYDLWLRIAARYETAILPERLVLRRKHGSSVTDLAGASGELSRAVAESFARHAPMLFGCPAEEARLLRERRHPCAVACLLRIAGHLERRRPMGLLRRIRSQSFVHALRVLAGPRDLASKAAWLVLRAVQIPQSAHGGAR